jgi:AAA domain
MDPATFETLARGHALFMAALPDTKAGGAPRQALARNAAEATSLLSAWDKPGTGVFYTPAHLREGETRRCKENMTQTSSLWVDVDRKQHPDLMRDEILRRIRQARHQPTRIYESGGGFHLYFDLTETVPITDEAVEALRLLAGFFGGDPAVCEPSRLMRLVGSRNWKYGDPREVVLIEKRNGRFELSDVVDWLLEDAPVMPAPAVAECPSPATANGHDPAPDAWASFAEASGGAQERLDVDEALAAMTYPGNVHTTQIRVALSLVQAGVPVEDVVARIMEATRRAAGTAGAAWDWKEEELTAIRRGAIGSAFKKLCSEYDPATGEIPAWVPPEMQPKWGDILARGGIPRIQPASIGGTFFLRDVSGVIEAKRRDAKGSTKEPEFSGPLKCEYAATAPVSEAPASKPAAPAMALPGPKGKVKYTYAPYVAPAAASIPRRQWLYGSYYLRGAVGASLGAPGRLKSTTVLAEAISMVVRRDFIHGQGVEEFGDLRVAYFNGEENQDELDRRFAAICQHYGITEEMYAGRIWVVSTRDQPIRLAKPGPRGSGVIDEDVVNGLAGWCDANRIDVLIVDPLVSFHRVRENDPGDMDMLCKEGFAVLAGTTRAIELVVHPRKPAPGEVNTTVEDFRGSSAQVAAIRTVRTFNFVTSSDATKLGIDEDQRRNYVQITIGRGSPGPAGKARWVKIEVVTLANGDDVATAVKWRPPDNFVSIDPSHTEAVVACVRAGQYRVDPRSDQWLGWRVAQILGLKVRPGKPGKVSNADNADKAKIREALQAWEEAGILAREDGVEDKHRKKAQFYVLGRGAAEMLDLSDDDRPPEV